MDIWIWICVVAVGIFIIMSLSDICTSLDKIAKALERIDMWERLGK